VPMPQDTHVPWRLHRRSPRRPSRHQVIRGRLTPAIQLESDFAPPSPILLFARAKIVLEHDTGSTADEVSEFAPRRPRAYEKLLASARLLPHARGDFG